MDSQSGRSMLYYFYHPNYFTRKEFINMKGKRIAAILLALAMSMSLL